MKFFAVAALFVAGALAAPAALEERGAYKLCSGTLYSVPQCCATDVLGVADLDCATPRGLVANVFAFQKTCAKVGQRARCCTIPILGQGLLCVTPTGAF